jgi:hydroxymethyl cephem carbamoyltransferase
MLIVGVKPGHDGAIAVVSDRKLLFSIEGEKDSFYRHDTLHADAILSLAERVGQPPDVIALGGWEKPGLTSLGYTKIGGGYIGADHRSVRSINFFGRSVKLFSSSHERSHIAMAAGMAPKNDSRLHAVLVWEGTLGHFYLLDEQWSVQQSIPVMSEPGNRFGFLYGLADPTFPDSGSFPRVEDAGKLMALAAYGDPADASPQVADTVERILSAATLYPAPKGEYRDSPLYNAEVESEDAKVAAALLSKRIFEIFARAAQEQLPEGLPLYISGGCGLNCDWNVAWRELGHFSSVFVPPCANDSGSALGTAMDALAEVSGEPHIDWNVYSGLDFELDREPDSARWDRRHLDEDALAAAVAGGQVVAWVQGRWEIGPRALGARSILAEPFEESTRIRLNEIKQREGFRPIAPCCRLEDVGKLYTDDFEDPYMLYFRRVRTNELGAVTHVDGSARVQTVTEKSHQPLYGLLSAFAKRSGVGVLCNTSLNFKGYGFINRMSDLLVYCETREIPEIVVGDTWFRDTSSPVARGTRYRERRWHGGGPAPAHEK